MLARDRWLIATTSTAILLGPIIASASAATNHDPEEIWQNISVALSYHCRPTAITKLDESGNCLLSIAEPLPKLTHALLVESFADRHFTRKTIGYDAWGEDWVTPLGPVDKGILGERLARPQLAAAGTARVANTIARIPWRWPPPLRFGESKLSEMLIASGQVREARAWDRLIASNEVREISAVPDAALEMEGIVQSTMFSISVSKTETAHVVIISNSSPPPETLRISATSEASLADAFVILGPHLRSITGRAANDNLPLYFQGYHEREIQGLIQSVGLSAGRQSRFGPIVGEGAIPGQFTIQTTAARRGGKPLGVLPFPNRTEPPRYRFLRWLETRGNKVFPWQRARIRRLSDADLAQVFRHGNGAGFVVEIPPTKTANKALFFNVFSVFKRKPNASDLTDFETALTSVRDVAAEREMTLVETLETMKLELLENEVLQIRGLAEISFIVREMDTGDILITRNDGAQNERANG